TTTRPQQPPENSATPKRAPPAAGLKPGDRYCQTDSITARDVTPDQPSRIDLDAAKPFHSKAFKTALKGSVNGICSRETDQRFFDLVALPQLAGARVGVRIALKTC